MPDRTIAMRESEAGLHQLPIDLIEEAELDRIGSVGPDSEVAAALGQGGAKRSGVSWMHGASLPCGSAYPSVTSGL